MSSDFKDHFSALAATYAQSRPSYQKDLFAWLAAQCAEHELAWDCGTGNGQAAHHLVDKFARVIATDASAAQISEAEPHPRIEYRVAPAERSGLDDAVADIVTVAQALHWFDLDRFYAEARRVLKPGGLVAAWCYGTFRMDDPTIDHALQEFYAETVGPYWPPERRHVEAGYRDLAFPFARIAAPSFSLSADWSLAELAGYLRSWSATGRYVAANGTDPVARLEALLAAPWSDPRRPRRFTWSLALLVGRAQPPHTIQIYDIAMKKGLKSTRALTICKANGRSLELKRIGAIQRDAARWASFLSTWP
ncbi:class I SAM-dependent methyltransferase [Hyphomicrobium sp.]|uniref:class I SAM-dependent methyltransferase n=1 Tax=Hyphomicrobium sp. TaxID=82 RepID=UPI0025C3FBD2|nr:class I SAM-dependent methyltransferase [Hyphomicrobium sp.]MCC7252966.1 methyltransferase domain-containing protein [Hyphomicrobium sp.]